MMQPQKKHRIANLKLREISSVDRPAQVGAVSVLMKRANDHEDEGVVTMTDIRKNAAAVANGTKPAFTVMEYEDAMLDRAAELGREMGCTKEQALAKCLSSDQTLRELAAASETARYSAYGEEVRKRHRPDAA